MYLTKVSYFPVEGAPGFNEKDEVENIPSFKNISITPRRVWLQIIRLLVVKLALQLLLVLESYAW